MADPLSASTGVVRITAAALHGVELLSKDLGLIRDAPEIVRQIAEDVHKISEALHTLQGTDSEFLTWLGSELRDETLAAVKSCGLACDALRSDIQHWTKRSKGNMLSWLNGDNTGVFSIGQLMAHVKRLQTSRLTLVAAVNTTSLCSIPHNGPLADSMRTSIQEQQRSIVLAAETNAKELAETECMNSDLMNTIYAAMTGPQSNDLALSRNSTGELTIRKHSEGKLQMRSTARVNEIEEEDESDEDEVEEERTKASWKELLKVLRDSQTLLEKLVARVETAGADTPSGSEPTYNISFSGSNSGMQNAVNHGNITWNNPKQP